MDLELTGKLAFVTASSGGIGKEIARSLAREGARVVVNGRSEASVENAAAAIRATVPDADLIPLPADCGTPEGCAAAIETIERADILVNNLGIFEPVGFFDEPDEDWQRLFEVNIMSGVRLSRHYLKGMLERGHGRVVFISSESGIMPAPEMAHYSATKTMQLSITRSLAELTTGTRVTVNAVLPGPTFTEGVQDFLGGVYPGLELDEAKKRFIKENRPTSLIERFIDPVEIGDVVAFVCSERAAIINGTNIRAEGGLVRSAF